MNAFRYGWLVTLAFMAILPSRGADDDTGRIAVEIGKAHAKILTEAAMDIKSLKSVTTFKLAALDKEIAGLEKDSAAGRAKPVYLQTLSDATAVVRRAQKSFDDGLDLRSQNASAIFFGDILSHYSRTSRAIERMTASNIPEVKNAILSDLDRTQSAYLMVADHNTLIFDLNVETHPAGAVITYRREAEDFKTYENPSDTTIHNLVIASWLVHVELKGYKPVEKWHDAATNPDSKVVFVLEPN